MILLFWTDVAGGEAGRAIGFDAAVAGIFGFLRADRAFFGAERGKEVAKGHD